MFADNFDVPDPTDVTAVLHHVTAEDVCDDSEGFHIFRAGEVIDGRFVVCNIIDASPC